MSEIYVPSGTLFLPPADFQVFVLCRLTKTRVCPVQRRRLSGADAVTALRPFYFAVHPDFFAQHPKERVGVCSRGGSNEGPAHAERHERPHAGTRLFQCVSAFSSCFCAPQEVNENSLKRLNGYLENLQKPGSQSAQSAQPLRLTFYIRETKDDAAPGMLGSGKLSRNPTFF